MKSYDVAIVGMGPVGAAAAVMFGHAGLRVAAFERDPEVYSLPRAVAMDGELGGAVQSRPPRRLAQSSLLRQDS